MRTPGHLVVISNRLPVTIDRATPTASLNRSGGGLVSALVPVLQRTGGSWIGWTGTDYDHEAARLIENSHLYQDYSFEPIFLTAAESASFYDGFSNEIIWPLFHGLTSRCLFDSSYWAGCRNVTEKFADATEAVARQDSLLWIHDYHLMMLPQAIRARGMNQSLRYFHHIPFPPPDVFAALPWRAEILSALMACDLIGFQTQRDRRNFMACLREFVPESRVESDAAKIVTCPVSIDFEEFAGKSLQPNVLAASHTMKRQLRTPIILGVDRLDYTKGIPERLAAFQKLLECNRQLRENVSLVQIVVPSREGVAEYQQLRLQIETLVTKINGQYGSPSWTPVHYFYRSIPRDELAAFYRAADIALVTPLRDGMNLVAKEFCAARIDNGGVLILSEFAGAAEELRSGALIVNPYDAEGLVSSILRALRMSPDEQRTRMEMMRSQIRTHDVFHWSESFVPASAFEAVQSPLQHSVSA